MNDSENHTENRNGISLYHGSAQQSVRLLELAPELPAQLASDNPPKLYFKSAPVPIATEGPAIPNHVVLCTDSETYHLRQIQTSNSVLVTQPTAAGTDDEPSRSGAGITYFSSPDCTLEMQKVSVDVIPFLVKVLEPYDGETVDVEMTDPSSSQAGQNKKYALFDDIPASTGECLRAWRELVAFEHGGNCYLPSAKAVLAVVKALSTGAFAQGLDITNPVQPNEILELVEDAECPRVFVESVYQCISDKQGSFTQLNKDSTVHVFGRTLLEAKSKDTAINKQAFLDEWRDLLPEKWRDHAELSKIERFYIEESTSSIKYKNPRQATTSSAKPVSARRWHEKFRRT